MKTLIDVSHIMGWPGNLTGIERVEYNLIKHYYEAGQAGFICWDDANGRFREAGREEVEKAVIGRSSESEQQNAAPGPNKTTLAKIRRKLKKTTIAANNISDGQVIVLVGLWDNRGYIEGLKRLATDHELVHIVYDMIPLVQQGFVVDYLPPVFANYMYQVLPLCKAVFAISKATANDTRLVLEKEGLRVPIIKTFGLGNEVSRAASAVRPAAIEDKFILAVGTIEARKNHTLLYYAYKDMLARGYKPPQLIIVGKRGWLTSDLQYILEHDGQVKDCVKILERVTDSELRWLYENCLFSVFPSFYEGWGLPVSESLNYGKVTLSSNTSSLAEAGGKYADYFSPYSAEGLAKLITKYMVEDVRQKRSRQIQKDYHPLSWAKAATEFAANVDKL